mmetsp:Transcript_6479/g.9535  ORF Transcript_6479/g.9535 Transcript_6479/m.9535 type:complete len:268 (+) Transcript_6479:105-908(+)
MRFLYAILLVKMFFSLNFVSLAEGRRLKASKKGATLSKTPKSKIKKSVKKSKDTESKPISVADACAKAHFEEFSVVAMLCKELSAEGFDVGVDDPISVGTTGHQSGESLSFTMREILEAEDPEAAYFEAEANTNDVSIAVVDYGWCSMNAGFVTGIIGDTADYCNPNQGCSFLYPGCDTNLSSCCIEHDKCLNTEKNTWKCSQTDCRGGACDLQLSSCAYNVSCCTFGIFCDNTCLAVKATIASVMSFQPNIFHNHYGSNTNPICGP